MNDLVSRAFDTLYALLIASILGTILLGASAVFADDSSAFFFDEAGHLQMNGAWTPTSPRSYRSPEEERNQYREWANAETLRKNNELVESYYSPKPTAPPSASSDYWVTGPDGRSRWCRTISKHQVICQ